ncbi:MAG: PAS domain-containing protein [Alphaproteobacteria bacterium]
MTADAATRTIPAGSDFAAIFAACPNPYLLLDSEFYIVGVNDAYCRATMTRRGEIIGRHLFDVFPDNPDDLHSNGTANLHASLIRVVEYARPDAMPVQKYDIRKSKEEGGGFEVRYWSPLNSPVLDANGNVKWIIHYVEDVTEIVQKRVQETQMQEFAREQQRIIRELRSANAELSRHILVKK